MLRIVPHAVPRVGRSYERDKWTALSGPLSVLNHLLWSRRGHLLSSQSDTWIDFPREQVGARPAGAVDASRDPRLSPGRPPDGLIRRVKDGLICCVK